MNIALITDEFIPHTDGITKFLINFRNGLDKLGDKIFVFNSTFHDPNNHCYKIISSKKTFKSIFNQKLSFFLFLFFFFYKVLRCKGISFNTKLKLIYYYFIYPKNLVNRIITINHLFNSFNEFNIDIVFCGKSVQPLIYSFILSHLFKKPLMSLASKDDFIVKYPFNLNSILIKKSDRIIVENEALKQVFIKIFKVNPDKVSMIHLSSDINSDKVKETKLEFREKAKTRVVGNYEIQDVKSDFFMDALSLEYQKIIKKTYLDYYYYSEGSSFHVKLHNPFQI